MKTQLCHICGWDFEECYSVGDICPCCFNEYGFDDRLEKQEILDKFCNGDRAKLYTMAPETNGVPDDMYVADEIAWRFLRLVWVKDGCSFKWKEEKPKSWTISDAKKQLEKIGYYYDALLALAEKVIEEEQKDEP